MKKLKFVLLCILIVGCQAQNADQNAVIQEPTQNVNQFLLELEAEAEFCKNKPGENAVSLVRQSIEKNELGITTQDVLRTRQNPKGEGVFVYLNQIRFHDVQRFCIWLVLDSKAYPLNSPSKGITPSLPWPREAGEKTWDKTGLDRFMPAAEAIKILWLE